MLNIGGIKLSPCQSLGLKSRDNVDDRCGGVPHVARFVQKDLKRKMERTVGFVKKDFFARGRFNSFKDPSYHHRRKESERFP